MGRWLGAAILALLPLALGGCGDGPLPHETRGPDVEVPPGSPWVRPGDALMQRPDLRALVDAQARRDATPLIRAMEHADPVVRARAALALASVGDPNAVQSLIAGLGDEDPNVRRDAAFALGRVGGYGVPEALLTALPLEEQPEVADAMVQALGAVGERTHLQSLISGGAGQRPSTWAVGMTIARFGMRDVHDPTALGWLTSRLQSPDPDTRVAAAYFFSRVPLQAWTRGLDDVRLALGSYGPEDPAAMYLALGLGNARLPDDEPLLVTVLRQARDWRTRANAALGLTRPAPAPETRAALLDALHDPSARVVIAAASALSAVREPPPGDRGALLAFVAASGPQDWQPAAALLPLLARLGEGEAIREWIEKQPESGIPARTAGVEALALSPDPAVTGELLDLLASSSAPVAGAAMRGLARRWAVMWRDGADPALGFAWFLRGLERSEFAVASPAASSLSDEIFAPLGAADSLIAALDHIRADGAPLRVQGALMVALGRMGDERVRPMAEAMLESDDPSVARAANRALMGLGDEALDFSGEMPWRPGVDWDRLSRLGRHPVLVLETDRGTIRLQLDAEAAPQTVGAVTALAEAGRYDGVPFHRVEPNFVVQGGDVEAGLGYGGPGFNIRSEVTPEPFRRGTLGLASAGKDTEGSQFFINHVMAPHLDGSYTVLGWVNEGMATVDALRRFDVVRRASVEPGDGGS